MNDPAWLLEYNNINNNNNNNSAERVPSLSRRLVCAELAFHIFWLCPIFRLNISLQCFCLSRWMKLKHLLWVRNSQSELQTLCGRWRAAVGQETEGGGGGGGPPARKSAVCYPIPLGWVFKFPRTNTEYPNFPYRLCWQCKNDVWQKKLRVVCVIKLFVIKDFCIRDFVTAATPKQGANKSWIFDASSWISVFSI